AGPPTGPATISTAPTTITLTLRNMSLLLPGCTCILPARRGRGCRGPDPSAYSVPEARMRIAIVFSLIVLAGCSREDAQRLGRVGRVVGEKVRDAAPAKTPLGEINPEATPAGRVRTR